MSPFHKRLLLLAALACGPVQAEPTLAEVNANLAAAEQRPVGEAGRDNAVALLQQTKTMLEAAAAHRADADKYGQALEKSAPTLRKLQADLVRVTRADPTLAVSPDLQQAPAADLQRRMEAAVNDRASLEAKLGVLDQRERWLAERPGEISQLKTDVTSRIAAIEVELSSLPGSEGAETVRLRKELLEAEYAARQAELDSLNAEQTSHAASAETNSLKRRVAQSQLATASAQVEQFERRLLERRAEELRRIQEDADRVLQDTTHAPPQVRHLAGDNVRFGKMLSTMLDDQSRAVQARADDSAQRHAIAQEFDRARQRVQLAGTSSSLGRVLVEQRRNLPDVRSLNRLARKGEAKIAELGLQQIEIDEQLGAAREAARNPVSLASEDGTAATPLDPATTAQLQALLKDQVDLLASLDENYASARRSLDAADFELQQLIRVVNDYRTFLDERLLWLPNSPVLSTQFVHELLAAGQWLVRASTWKETSADLQRGAAEAWPRAIAFSLLAVLVYRFRGRLRKRRLELAEHASDPAVDEIRSTLEALGIGLVLALPTPLFIGALSTLLAAGYANGEFSVALGQVLARMAWLTFGVRAVIEFLSQGGVAVAHFNWPALAVKAGRGRIARFGVGFVPAYALATVFEWSSNPPFQYSFRRLCFLAAMATSAVFLRWATRREGVLYQALARRASGSRLIAWWPGLAVAVWVAPIALTLLSVLGYQYAALELSSYCLQTAWLLVGAVVIYNLTLRWLTLAQSRMAAEFEAAALRVTDEELAHATVDRPDFATMNAQSRMIFRNLVGWSAAVGLFWIWRDVLPALGALDQISLWDVQVKDADGLTHASPITLASAVLAGLIATISVLAARNMPSLLEMAVFRRLPMHRGSRYALNTLTRYLIAALGVTLTLSTLGLRWSQVQWLVAALGVGLGFGLQEIFANFISGLILLFERPIRVGDFVTIGDLTGRVARIQIRATTIADADNREIVVPNRNFITEKFVNWTLTDSVTRLVLPVGVAYGSNLGRVLALLLEIAKSNPRVLVEPAPCAVFTSFGDSALNLELQVYAREVPQRIELRHELNTSIYEAFGAEGFEIPFPQRDVHVRSVTGTLPPGPG